MIEKNSVYIIHLEAKAPRLIDLGVQAPKLIAQFETLGITAEEYIEQWQRDLDAITWLAVHGMITPSGARLAHEVLVKKIERAVRTI